MVCLSNSSTRATREEFFSPRDYVYMHRFQFSVGRKSSERQHTWSTKKHKLERRRVDQLFTQITRLSSVARASGRKTLLITFRYQSRQALSEGEQKKKHKIKTSIAFERTASMDKKRSVEWCYQQFLSF